LNLTLGFARLNGFAGRSSLHVTSKQVGIVFRTHFR
jgi:hypothetical protein